MVEHSNESRVRCIGPDTCPVRIELMSRSTWPKATQQAWRFIGLVRLAICLMVGLEGLASGLLSEYEIDHDR